MRARSRRPAALGVAVLLAATTAAGQPPQPPEDSQQVFRAGVDIVSLSVTVADAQGRYVTDLTAGEFSVFEDGVLQDLTFFTRINQPIALSLLIDTSASMDHRMGVAQEAAIGFARRLRPQDLAQVVDFDSRVTITQDFTNDAAALERAIRETTAGGSTALFNALYISLRELAKIRATSPDEVRRQAIVLLSDGEDTSSLVDFEEVMELAKRSETAIYAIGLQPRDATAARGFREAEYVLRQLSQETGGRAIFVTRAEDLAGIYDRIGDELSSQYTLAYTSKNPRRDGAFRRLVVQVSRPGLTARTKRGYYAPTSN